MTTPAGHCKLDGGDIAAEYIATQFWLDGLKAAGDDGTFFQKVPMVGITPAPETTFEIAPNKGEALRLKPLEDYVAYDETQKPADDIDAAWQSLGSSR